MIRVLLAEDQGMMRGALALLLGLEPDIEVVAEVATGAEVVAEAVRVRPDVALLDIEMPGVDGLTAAAELRQRLPAARCSSSPRSDGPGTCAEPWSRARAGSS